VALSSPTNDLQSKVTQQLRIWRSVLDDCMYIQNSFCSAGAYSYLPAGQKVSLFVNIHNIRAANAISVYSKPRAVLMEIANSVFLSLEHAL